MASFLLSGIITATRGQAGKSDKRPWTETNWDEVDVG